MMPLTHSLLKEFEKEFHSFINHPYYTIKSQEELSFLPWPTPSRQSPFKKDKDREVYNKNDNNNSTMNTDVEIRSILIGTNNNKNNNNTTTTTTTTTPLSLESPEQHHLHQNHQISSPSFSHLIADPGSISPQVIPLSSVSNNSLRITTTRSRHVSGGTTEDRLTSLPEKRPLPWREGVDPGAENETGGESRRKQIRFGCLLATRGEIQAVPCNSCANGRGKFSVCISLPNFFKGACASCQLSGRPNRCSIKKTEDVLDSPNIMRMINSTQVENAEDTSLPRYESYSNNFKRRKVTAAMLTDDISAWDDTPRQTGQEQGDSSSSQSNTGSRQWATVNRQIVSQITQPAVNSITENSPATQKNLVKANTQSGLSRNWSSVAQMSDGSETNGFVAQLDRSIEGDKPSTERGDKFVLIDTLPKAKQRQVYGLMSGIQGGIDHLQRELNSLRNALGIDDKD